MSIKLTENAITNIANGEWKSPEVQPVVQVTEIRTVQSQLSAAERYRVLFSDGVSAQGGMLNTQLNDLVRSQQMQIGSIVRLTEYTPSLINGRMLFVIAGIDVILQRCDIIGNPRQRSSQHSNGPPTSMSLAPMQSINQPAIAMSNHTTFTGGSLAGSVLRPNFTANSSIYSPQQEHNAGLHSYGMVNAPNIHSRPPANNFTRSVQATYNQHPPMHMNRGPLAKNETAPKILPIVALNPYQGRWTIKARVTAKAELRHYNNAKGDGKVFSFDLLDATGGEIRVTCFNAVADQFYDQIEAGKVYLISKGSVKPAQKAFNHLKNDHEITLDSTSTIQPCYDDDGSIPPQQFHFRPIADIEGLDNNYVLDIIGVVHRIFPSSSITRKNTNTETLKRNLHIKDMSGRSVEVTLWGNFCNTEGQALQNMVDDGVFPVLAVKSARVSEFNGKAVGTISTSQLFIEPDFPEVHKLRVWFDNVGKNITSVSLSRDITHTDVWKKISQIKDEKLGTSEKADWITVSATIWHMKVENFCYTACPLMSNDRKCNKKVTNNGDGKWHCDKCDQDVDECHYRYILQLQLQDHTDSTWATAFEESGEQIMGVSAKDLYCMKYEEQDEDRFTEIIRNVLCSKYKFKLKVKEETFNDETRVKSTIVKAEKVKLSSDTSFLLDSLKKDDPTSVVPKVDRPTLGSGYNSQIVNAGFKESAPFSNRMGSASGVGRQAASPESQMGHYGNQYGGSGLNTSCNSCGGLGHNYMNCPSIVNPSGGRQNSVPYGGVSSGASDVCYKCKRPGHWANDCPGVSNVTSVYGGGNVAPGRYGSASGQYVGGY